MTADAASARHLASLGRFARVTDGASCRAPPPEPEHATTRRSTASTAAAAAGPTVYNTGLCHRTASAASAAVDPEIGNGPLVGIDFPSGMRVPPGTWENSPFPTGTACSRAEWTS